MQLVAARRPLNATAAEGFAPLARQQLLQSERSIKVTGLTQLDGQYVVLVGNTLGSALEIGDDDDW